MSKPTILAVDDDATAREELAALLANEECQTTTVSTRSRQRPPTRRT